MTLHMLQLRPEPAALMRFLSGQGLNRNRDADLGYGIHAWLAALFGDMAPAPFRFQAESIGRRMDSAAAPRPPKLLAYTTHGADALLEHAETFAEPEARAVCPLDRDLVLAPMPSAERWRPGRRLGFEVLTCPVARRARSGVERDLFLHHADRAAPDAELSREHIYGAWLRERLAGAAELQELQLASFRLTRLWRRGRRSDGHRSATSLFRPAALLRGNLTVTDGEAFHRLLARGIGRHRAFGYGMLLLTPVR